MKGHPQYQFPFFKVFKAKYFPNCSILDEEVKTHGSYACQSILKARSIVCQRASWRIGNGERVLIRGDNWLPDPYCRQVISPPKNFPNNTHLVTLLQIQSPWHSGIAT